MCMCVHWVCHKHIHTCKSEVDEKRSAFAGRIRRNIEAVITVHQSSIQNPLVNNSISNQLVRGRCWWLTLLISEAIISV